MVVQVVTSVAADTVKICAIYLVGGFSGRRDVGTRHHTRPLDIFRTKYQGPFTKICAQAEAGNSAAISALHQVIISELQRAKWLKFDGKEYTFNMTSFDNNAMAYLMREVMAQVNAQ